MSNMPQMKRPFGGAKPVAVQCTILDDATGSGRAWGSSIGHITEHVVDQLSKRFQQVRFDYTVMRDQEIGERDEERLRDAPPDHVLREQKLVVREGGGDAEETFFWSVEDYLSDASRVSDFTRLRAHALLMFTTSSSKPARHNDVLALGKELKRRGIYLFVIGTPGSNMEDLVHAALDKGFFFPLDASPGTEEAMQIAQRLSSTITESVGAQFSGQQ